MRRADDSSRGVLQSIVCRSVISKPRRGVLGPLGAVETRGGEKRRKKNLTLSGSMLILDFWSLCSLVDDQSGSKERVYFIEVCKIVAVYGSEAWTQGNNEERVVNAFETWCWRRVLKIKWTDRIKNDVVFQRANKERLLLQNLKK